MIKETSLSTRVFLFTEEGNGNLDGNARHSASILLKLSFLHVVGHRKKFVGRTCALLVATYLGYVALE